MRRTAGIAGCAFTHLVLGQVRKGENGGCACVQELLFLVAGAGVYFCNLLRRALL